MPLKTALRKTRLRPMAASSPGGQTTKISHSRTATTTRAISAHAGWRSMTLFTKPIRFAPAVPGRVTAGAAKSAACLAIDVHPPEGRDLLWDRVLGILTGGKAADLIESIFYRSKGRPSGTQHLGRTAVI